MQPQPIQLLCLGTTITERVDGNYNLTGPNSGPAASVDPEKKHSVTLVSASPSVNRTDTRRVSPTLLSCHGWQKA